MNLTDIRSDEDIVKWWVKVFGHANFRDGIWKMLNDTHPLRFVETAPVTTSSAEKRLGQIEGYEMALERLRLCAQFAAKPSELPQATFEDPMLDDGKA